MFLPLVMFSLGWFLGIYYYKYSTALKQNFETKIAQVKPTFERMKEEGNATISTLLFPPHNPLVTPRKEQNTTVPRLLSPLEQALKQQRFRDALNIYVEEESIEVKIAHKERLETFLIELLQSDFQKAQKFIAIYLKEIPSNGLRVKLVDTYAKRGLFRQAITEQLKLDEFLVSEANLTESKKRVQTLSNKYIRSLKEAKLYTILIGFLEEMIHQRPLDTFFKYELAELYALLNKKEELIPLLDELVTDELYGEKAKLLIENLASSKQGIREYKYTIPLTKHKEHYIVPTYIEGRLYRLIVDTGASSLFLDNDKLGNFKLLRENFPINTAGGGVVAKLYEAKSVTMGPITLEKIEVVAAPFKRDYADGLLGMNFFKQFVFFLDQDRALLYLNPKE
jgi:hypothetical protein